MLKNQLHLFYKKDQIVFVDIEISRMSGFEVVKKVREANAFTVFVFVTAFSQYAIKAIKESIFDYVLKPYDIDEIKSCIQKYET
ncbi:MAG: response regulator, partial [Bacteroidales bacterium]|nr:response regulator [Bacteroidales bacterium]